jgi:hypothetical protein
VPLARPRGTTGRSYSLLAQAATRIIPAASLIFSAVLRTVGRDGIDNDLCCLLRCKYTFIVFVAGSRPPKLFYWLSNCGQ